MLQSQAAPFVVMWQFHYHYRPSQTKTFSAFIQPRCPSCPGWKPSVFLYPPRCPPVLGEDLQCLYAHPGALPSWVKTFSVSMPTQAPSSPGWRPSVSSLCFAMALCSLWLTCICTLRDLILALNYQVTFKCRGGGQKWLECYCYGPHW